ncbi:hypothetical protein SPRG_00767 [Saprolegnia parasitica CBS 223.65]|uniref:Uncharacterized protein n=1 Tax=Saprolegnia parasitica (strain CBS 223.65) TaxID=695850 RepID=A0A067CVK9_SAPPC|nr:hypothetical protein SPRG_00767 [Saprolegnia parasitica CBS 223.65]KDO34704.1 hypothetical protein SPRG_00767 [Saprolegnia parasitica CBS 223.65]|eukprot:XP_012194374.1 hypothetical protein SPRG_00767 [Saprolegnia parasitica CBS 223.65]
MSSASQQQPTDDEERRSFLAWTKSMDARDAAIDFVTQFCESMARDLYPPASIERIFGVAMPTTEPAVSPGPMSMEEFMASIPVTTKAMSMGKIVFNVWVGLHKQDFFKEDDMVLALWKGMLPAYFMYCVLKKYHAGNGSYYEAELLQRGFRAIEWDLEVHEILTKEQNPPASQWQATPTSDVKTPDAEPRAEKGPLGLLVNGSTLSPCVVTMNTMFEKCPTAHAAGIPLYVRKCAGKSKKASCYIISRMMSDPKIGVASIPWTYGGACGPAPPVLVGRSDGVAFTKDDWAALDDFVFGMMLDDGLRSITRADFVAFARSRTDSKAGIILEALFPKGRAVVISGLQSSTELNGLRGVVTGSYTNGRIGVAIAGRSAPVAVAPTKLQTAP